MESTQAGARTAGVLTDWRPTDRLFAPTKGEVDPRLFDAARRMLPAVRSTILEDVHGFFEANGYSETTGWARVYLAGSQASEWYGNNDFDLLIGINYPAFRAAHPDLAKLSVDEIDARFNTAFREDFNDEEWHPPFDPKHEWHRTGYVNKNSWDIRDIKPYAAYNVTDDTWAVDPIDEPTGHQFGPSEWYYFEGIAAQVRNALALPEPMRTQRCTQLWTFVHTDRSRAFGPHGSGAFDRGNALEKYLDQADSGTPGVTLMGALQAARFGTRTAAAGVSPTKRYYLPEGGGKYHQANPITGQALCRGTILLDTTAMPLHVADDATRVHPMVCRKCLGKDHPAVRKDAARKVAKSSGSIEVAGIAIKAEDTGRVLLLQRSNEDEDDPARGTWEFPGGHIEGGESPFDGGKREWCEETGGKFPDDGVIVGNWISGGLYQGFIVMIPEESGLDINLDHEDRHVLNPDDPDGDMIEVVAWWDVKHLEGNPAIRKEVLKGTDWDLLKKAKMPKTAGADARVRLDDIEHGPEVPHALRALGHNPDAAEFERTQARVADYHPTHLDDIEDDEDYERTRDLIGHLDEAPPIIVAHHQGEKYLLDGHARMNAAHTEGRETLPAYRLAGPAKTASADVAAQMQDDLADHFWVHHPHLDPFDPQADLKHRIDHQLRGDSAFQGKGQDALGAHDHAPLIDPSVSRRLRLDRVAGLEDDDYRMDHRPPDRDGTPIHDLTHNFSEDIYTHPHYFSDMSEPTNVEAHRVIRRVRGNPDAKVHIYRALPAEHAHQGFRPGDWVSTSKEYARQHGRHSADPKHDWPVIHATVRADDLHTDGDDFREFGYNGTETRPGNVAFKGGYHQEVSDRADGGVRQVQRRPDGPAKGFNVTLDPSTYDDHMAGRGGITARDGEGNYAGHIRYDSDGVFSHNVEPQHAEIAEHLDRKMRSLLPKEHRTSAARKDPHHGEGPWYHGTGADLSPGDTLAPGDQVGAKSHGQYSDGTKVWVSNDPVRAGAYGHRLYEVTPHSRPRSPYAGHDEHHTTGATVVREVPWDEARSLSEKRNA